MQSAVPHDWSSERSTVGAASAHSLLFTVLGEYVLASGGEVWASTLVRGLGALGVEEPAARQAIARTGSNGWLEPQRVGRRVRWRLTRAGQQLLAAGAERIYGFGGSQNDWDGRWVLLFVDESNGAREKRQRLRTKLAWAGFGYLRAGTWIAAHTEREHEARAVLREFDLTDAVAFVASSGERRGRVRRVDEARPRMAEVPVPRSRPARASLTAPLERRPSAQTVRAKEKRVGAEGATLVRCR